MAISVQLEHLCPKNQTGGFLSGCDIKGVSLLSKDNAPPINHHELLPCVHPLRLQTMIKISSLSCH